MFHMLVCCDLKPNVSLAQFKDSITDFTKHLQQLDLATGVSPVGIRHADIPLDTDKERGHQHFVLMSFRDRTQAEAARGYLKSNSEPGLTFHRAVNSKAANPIFICWADC